ncbi:MAG: hypothetical protein PHR21_06155 [Oscillospiraceae bacterium]|nr:hypothetical protein [Oscillospiraceae bacterium]
MNSQTVQTIHVKPVMALLLFGGFLSLFNETILNVALSPLMAQFQVSATTVQWLSTGGYYGSHIRLFTAPL